MLEFYWNKTLFGAGARVRGGVNNNGNGPTWSLLELRARISDQVLRGTNRFAAISSMWSR